MMRRVSQVTDEVQESARDAANSRSLGVAARVGFGARGVVYLLIGVLALRLATGAAAQADRGGAVRELASNPFGVVVLWVCDLGFLGLALFLLGEAAFGARRPGGEKAGPRISSLARGLVYGTLFVTTLLLLVGVSGKATEGDTDQSRTWTARVMGQPGGRVLIGIAGLVVVGAGVALAWKGLSRKVLRGMDLDSPVPRLRSVVTFLGVVGSAARGAVAVLVGIFFVVAAVRFDPDDAQGVDGSLRQVAQAPFGRVLLAVIAVGLVLFGLFSFCEARWRRI